VTTKKIHAVVIRNSHEESTVAIVDADVDPDMVGCADDLFGAVSTAVTDWLHSLDPQEREDDFNVGDLMQNLPAEGLLKEALAKWGVHDLSIECHTCDSTSWEFDDPLFNLED
jgi:hypothetical protein